ncbi:MAG: glycosyltransferase family 2 protein [Candidatus Nanoarchaeia archaeon]|nr:glycosyltransferase family 2 protein [Candidatus Nanoarchaeia archaeon]
MKTSVIFLTLNEEASLEEMYNQMPNKQDIYEFLLVDGGSKDKTLEIAKRLGMKIVNQKETGRGRGFYEGMKAAKGDILIFFSPDGNEDPREIPLMIKKIEEGYDMVIASRFMKQSASHDVTFIRRIGNRSYAILTNLVFGTRLKDAVNGFRAIRKDIMERLNLEAKRFDIEMEMTTKVLKLKGKIIEVPTTEPKRIEGRSRLRTFYDGYLIYKRFLKSLKYKEI